MATLSDGAVLSFGLELADPNVHEANWLNCDPTQLKTAIRLINKHGSVRGERGLPKLLPDLNFIAGLNGETKATYGMNMALLRDIRSEGLLHRRINIHDRWRGEGFQEVPSHAFAQFKTTLQDEIDKPLLEELFPVGQVIHETFTESHDGRTRLPAHETDLRSLEIHGKAGITFGRQIGAYPILVGVEQDPGSKPSPA